MTRPIPEDVKTARREQRHQECREREVRRFWSKVLPDPETGCWVWQSPPRNSDGYGRFSQAVTNRGLIAHRYSYELAHGAIPDGLVIDHLCRNRICVNPAHLEAVTVAVNTLRGVGPAGIAHWAGICRRGHAFDEENTYRVFRPDGTLKQRVCKECARARKRQYRAQGRVA